MDLTLILERLQSQLKGLKSIGLSADLDAAIGGALALPAAFLIPLAEHADPLELIGVTSQRITVAFGVLHVVGNKRDAQGAAALGDLQSLRATLRSALVGWVPDAATGEPVAYIGGRLMRWGDDARLWWLDEFTFKIHYRSL